MYYCEECGQDYCEDCFSICDICQSSYCRGCLEEDRESGKSCCRNCRQHCKRCRRIVDTDSFDDETQLCPECLEEEQEPEEPIQTEEIQNEQQTIDPIPQATAPGPV